ncbi:MAG TPA: polysaccharide deacetylase family protein [Casimicrobiaceae bacterium]
MTRSLAVTDEPKAAVRTAWVRKLIGLVSPGGSGGRLSILIFHRVHARPDDLFPDEMHAASFRERMLWVRDWFNVLPLEEAVAALGRGALPARALSITFDDGYADNAAVALPILRELGLHATFFVTTGFLDGGRMWNDTVIESLRRASGDAVDLSNVGLGKHPIGSVQERRQAIDSLLAQLKYLPLGERQALPEAMAAQLSPTLPDDLMMTQAQLRGLAAAGMGFGGHTANHPILARLDDAAARREIADGRDALEGIVRQPVKLFAYPNGKPGMDYTATHVRMATELGFAAAVSTAPGAARAGSSVYELPRFTPWGRTPARWGARFARNLFTGVEVAAA